MLFLNALGCFGVEGRRYLEAAVELGTSLEKLSERCIETIKTKCFRHFSDYMYIRTLRVRLACLRGDFVSLMLLKRDILARGRRTLLADGSCKVKKQQRHIASKY